MRTLYHVSVVAFCVLVSENALAQGKLGPAPAAPPPSPAPPATVSSSTSDPPRTDTLVVLPTPTPPPSATTGSGPPTNTAPVAPGTNLPAPPGPPPGAAPPPYPYPQPYYPYPPPGQPGVYPQGWAPVSPAPKQITRWYGWQTLIGVVASDTVSIIGASGNIDSLLYIGIAGHVLTGPVVHWVHGHVGKGFASLGLNVGLPGLGLLAGAAAGGNNLGGIFLAFILGGLGYVAAPALDMGLLSTETVDAPAVVPKSARALLPSSVSVMPMLDQNRRGLMLVGQF